MTRPGSRLTTLRGRAYPGLAAPLLTLAGCAAVDPGAPPSAAGQPGGGQPVRAEPVGAIPTQGQPAQGEPAVEGQSGADPLRRRDQLPPQTGFEEPIEGYPEQERQIGTPIDVEADFKRGFPKAGAIFGGLIPKGYFKWKEDLYEDLKIKLAINATALGQWATDALDRQWLTGEDATDVAAGGSVAVEAKWELLNPGEDWQGGLTAVLDWRQGFGSAAVPAFHAFHTGSLWLTDVTVLEWDPWFPVLFWEQWADKDDFVARVGTQSAIQVLDFFRFKDARSSFTGSEFWFPVGSVPLPGPGFGASFEWWPQEDSPLYVVGTVNDVNFTIGENLAWDTAFDEADFFYGLEVGYNWGEFPTNFDHLHVELFYADERAAGLPGLPNKAGGGFKVRGSKQWGRYVGFGSYTYNNAEGGPFGFTLVQNAITTGAAYLQPYGIRGEIGLGINWGQPFDSFDGAAPVFQGLGDQYGIEAYWKMLLTPDLWFTPGVQYIIDPSFNPDVDSFALASLKVHLFL